MLQLIDRRPSSRGKSAVNRERFLRRYKSHIQAAVRRWSASGVSPTWSRAAKCACRRRTSPSRRSASAAAATASSCCRAIANTSPATASRGRRAAAAAAATAARGDGDSEDAFVFSLSREEFMQIFFDDLELPQSRAHRVRPHRAANEHPRRLHEDRRARPISPIVRTLRQSLARRIALGGSLARELAALEARIRGAAAVGRRRSRRR